MPPSKEYFRILSIDGGGIRGIIPAVVMTEIEKQIRAKHNDPTLNIGDCFDLIAGTSTGGILTLLALAPDKSKPAKARFSADDALQLYLRNGDEIFDRSTWHTIASLGGLSDEKYSAKNIEEILLKYFGDTQLKDLIKPCLVTAYDTKQSKPFFFTQHTAVNDPSANFYVRDAARATAAAPTYFEAALPESLNEVPDAMPMIDGGVFANNPSACALVEGIKIRGAKTLPLTQFAILSIGTGISPKSRTFGEIKNWGLAGWARPILDILMEGNSQTVDYELRTIFKSMGKPDNYLRINGDFRDTGLSVEGLDPTMDHASRENMARLQIFGQRVMLRAQEGIGKFVRDFL